jgi:hypothetical protein
MIDNPTQTATTVTPTKVITQTGDGTAGLAAPVLVIIGAIVVVFVLMYLVRVARENAQVSLTPGSKRKPRLVNGRRASAWEEAGRRTKVDSPEGTPREPGLGGVRGEGMFDDNDDEDNPDRPMSGDSPRGER